MLTRIYWRGAALAWLLCPGIGCAAAAGAGNVDTGRLEAADSEPQNWFTGGRDKDGTYFSPLTAIDAGNVRQLGFAWSYDLGEPQRGQEATPLVIDGVMYTSGTWGYVYAVNAASGKELWRFQTGAPVWGVAPITYMLDGVQWVVVPSGVTLTAFALPGNRSR